MPGPQISIFEASLRQVDAHPQDNWVTFEAIGSQESWVQYRANDHKLTINAAYPYEIIESDLLEPFSDFTLAHFEPKLFVNYEIERSFFSAEYARSRYLSKIIDFYFCVLLRVNDYYEVSCSFDEPDGNNPLGDEVEIEINGTSFGTIRL